MVPQFKPENVLVLGFAGGTVAGLIKLIYGDIPITAVDIKECIDNYGVNLIKADAEEYIKTAPKFDVVIVDLFKDFKMCDCVLTNEFVADLSKISNYIILNTLKEPDLRAYRNLNRYGSNKPNRGANRIYYFGVKQYDNLII
jgi:spermidine synthase